MAISISAFCYLPSNAPPRVILSGDTAEGGSQSNP